MIYTEEHTNKMTWSEFGTICDKLVSDIKNSGIKFDAITPILRSGMIPATIIANKLQILNILPVQVKCVHNPNDVKQMLPIMKPMDSNFPSNPKILVVEANTFSGKSATKVYEILKSEFANVELYYATVTRVFRKPINELEMYKKYFFGVMTDEELIASEEEKTKYKLRDKITIYPWETTEYELEDINAS